MELNAITLWLFSTFEKFDMNLALFFHKLYDFAGWFFTPFFEFVSFLGYYGIILVTLSIALMFFRKTRKYGTAMLLGAAIGALFTNCVLKKRILIFTSNNNVKNNTIKFSSEDINIKGVLASHKNGRYKPAIVACGNFFNIPDIEASNGPMSKLLEP